MNFTPGLYYDIIILNRMSQYLKATCLGKGLKTKSKRENPASHSYFFQSIIDKLKLKLPTRRIAHFTYDV